MCKKLLLITDLMPSGKSAISEILSKGYPVQTYDALMTKTLRVGLWIDSVIKHLSKL